MKIYLLSHRRNDLETDGGEVVGVFTTEDKARQAIAAFNQGWGFQVSPVLFEIDGYELDTNP